MSRASSILALVVVLLLLLLGGPGLANEPDPPPDADAAGTPDGVTTRKPGAGKLRKQHEKATSDLHGGSEKKQRKGKAELQRLEAEASDKVDRALESPKAPKKAKLGERENLTDAVQDTLAGEGIPLRQPRRRWRPPADVGERLAVDPGDFVGSWRNRRRLAEGAQGTVDLLVGEDDRVGEVLVLKATKAAQSDRLRQRRLLAREAEMQNLAAGDGHPNFVRARHLADNQIAMPYAGGRLSDALNRLKDRDRYTADEYKAVAQYLTREMLGAARHLDEVGVVHRDLKPENILLDSRDRRLKIVDFGAAKRTGESDNELSRELRVARGTQGYMSFESSVAMAYAQDPARFARDRAANPEYPDSLTTGPRSDVFSIGRILQRDLAADGLGDGFTDLQAQLVRNDVRERPDAATALTHPFLGEPTSVPPARVQEILSQVARAVEVAEVRAARLERPDIGPTQALRRPPGEPSRQRPPIPSFEPPPAPDGAAP